MQSLLSWQLTADLFFPCVKLILLDLVAMVTRDLTVATPLL